LGLLADDRLLFLRFTGGAVARALAVAAERGAVAVLELDLALLVLEGGQRRLRARLRRLRALLRDLALLLALRADTEEFLRHFLADPLHDLHEEVVALLLLLDLRVLLPVAAQADAFA